MIHFIDTNCMIGPRQQVREGAVKNTAELLALMDDVGISQAVVYHSAAKEADASLGNQLLTEECNPSSRFLKQWAVLPNVWDEFMEPEELSLKMKEENVRSVRLFPKTYDHSLEPYAAGELLSFLSDRNIPIFIDRAELPSWKELYELCTNYPQGTFILCDVGYDSLRQLVPIVKSCPNLLVDTSTLLMHQSIRDFCFHFGAERLIFGSGAPIHSMAAAVSLIRYSEVSLKEQELIATQNIQRLLGEVYL